jgi:hypothetical protein
MPLARRPCASCGRAGIPIGSNTVRASRPGPEGQDFARHASPQVWFDGRACPLISITPLAPAARTGTQTPQDHRPTPTAPEPSTTKLARVAARETKLTFVSVAVGRGNGRLLLERQEIDHAQLIARLLAECVHLVSVPSGQPVGLDLNGGPMP